MFHRSELESSNLRINDQESLVLLLLGWVSTGVGKTRNKTKRNKTGSGNQTTPKWSNNPL